MNGQAARKQTDGQEYRNLEHIVRLRATHALANVKDVGNHKDHENRSLGGDQAVHTDRPARGRIPSDVALGPDYGCCAHRSRSYSYCQSGSSGCFKSHSGRRLFTSGIVAKLYSGGGEVVDHSSVHASHGSLPATFPRKYDHIKLPRKIRTAAALK